MQARDSDGNRADPLDTAAWFDRTAPLVLEIGCGTGSRRSRWPAAEPDLDVIAVEVYRRGLAQLLSAIDRDGLTNMRLIRGDGVDVLEHLLAPAIADRCAGVLPRPVAQGAPPQAPAAAAGDRRTDRRPAPPGGVLHAATDHAGYAEQIAEVGDAEPAAAPAVERVDDAGTLPISVRRPVTKYEDKAQRAGSAVTELLWERRAMSVDRRDLAERRAGHRRDRGRAGRTAAAARTPQRVLLVWDAPNLDMGLGSILGGRPTAAHRPRFDALGRWLLARTAELSAPRRPTSRGLARARGHGLHQHRARQRRRRPAVGRGAAQRRFRGVRQTQDRRRQRRRQRHARPHRAAPQRGPGQRLRRLRRRPGVPAAARGHRPGRHRRSACSDFANMRVGR